MRRALLLLLLLSAPAWAQSPCDGKISDQQDRPMEVAAVPKPGPGDSYIDPVFGTLVTRITQASGTEGTLAVWRTLYNTMRGWNADESWIIVWHRGSPMRYELFEGDKPYSHLCQINFEGSTTPTDIEKMVWDPEIPNVLYFPTGYGASVVPNLRKMTITDTTGPICGRTIEVVREFNECEPYNLTPALRLGHAHDMAVKGSEKAIQLTCGNLFPASAPRLYMLYSIAEDRIMGSVVQENVNYRESMAPFQNGQGAYDRWHSGQVFDKELNEIRVIGPSPNQHSAMATTPAGERYNLVNFDPTTNFPHSGSILSVSMETGTVHHVMSQQNGWPYPRSGTHPSVGAADGSGWIAVSHIGYPRGDPPLMGQQVLENEITLANVATGEVCRVAHARTYESRMPTGFQWDYWAEPHPQISRSGYRVLFNSDFLGSDTVDMYVLDLRPQDITIITSALPNAVIGESYDEVVTIVGGQSPYTCSVIGALPAGLSLAGCTVSGTATGIESGTFSIQACDSVPDCTLREFTVVTQERPQITTVSPLPDAPVGSVYTQSFSAQRGIPPYAWSTAGNTCSTSFVGANLTGTPMCLETCSFSVTVTDSHAQPISATEPFEFDVVVPSGGGCPCAPSDLSVEVVQ